MKTSLRWFVPACVAFSCLVPGLGGYAQSGNAAGGPAGTTPAPPPAAQYKSLPSFDLSSIDRGVDPCNDFYQFACGHFAEHHPIPPDQAESDTFYTLFNVDTQELNGLLTQAEQPSGSRTPDERKVGDYYHACMDTSAIERDGLTPIAPLLKRIDSMSVLQMPEMTGELERMGVPVLLSYGEQQDFKDATKQIAEIDQGGLGLPEKDFYLRTGAADEAIRKAYVDYITKLLTYSGSSPQVAAREATNILGFETSLAKANQGNVERRDPETVYHLVPVAQVSGLFPGNTYTQFEDAIHSPHVTELNDVNPAYLPALIGLVRSTDIATLRAYFRFHLLSSVAGNLPDRYDQAYFDFYGKVLNGTIEQRPRWQRCTFQVDGELGEALGKVYVAHYFAGDSKRKVLEMVGDIESAMDRDLDQLDWMLPATKVKAKEKLHAIANKIGYPDHWRDYTALTISPDDAVGNELRGNAFESDRELAKIGKPVDRGEWGMSPPTVNAYYDPSMNNINFPAGILQPSFYEAQADDAVNYGHIGAVIGHELTHGFDDEGRKFDAHGNLSDWWTAEDKAKFETKTDCEVNEYNKFTPVADLHINGKLTLGENTADNGGLLLAYMAYLDRAKQNHEDLSAKVDGFTGPQQFYIAFAQNWCANQRPEALRTEIQTDPHSPDQYRVDGSVVNQPGFAKAFSCKAGSAMVPANSCRVW